jgi:hypothetical protein
MPPKNDACGTCHEVRTPGRKAGSRGNPHDMGFAEVETVQRGRPPKSEAGGTDNAVRGQKHGVRGRSAGMPGLELEG